MEKSFSAETTKKEMPSRIEKILSEYPDILETYTWLKSNDSGNPLLYKEELYVELENIEEKPEIVKKGGRLRLKLQHECIKKGRQINPNKLKRKRNYK